MWRKNLKKKVKKVNKHENGNVITTLLKIEDAKFMNDWYKNKAELNKVTGIPSLLKELYYRWKSNPSLGGLPEKSEKQSSLSLKELWNKPLFKIDIFGQNNIEKQK